MHCRGGRRDIVAKYDRRLLGTRRFVIDTRHCWVDATRRAATLRLRLLHYWQFHAYLPPAYSAAGRGRDCATGAGPGAHYPRLGLARRKLRGLGAVTLAERIMGYEEAGL